MTDHCPIFICLNLPEIIPDPTIKITFRCNTQENLEKLRYSLYSKFVNYNFENDLNIATENFIQLLNSEYRKFYQIKVKYLSKNRIKKPWLTSGIIQSIRNKSKYFKMHKLGFVSKEFNNMYRNQLLNLIRKSKYDYFNKVFNQNKNNLSQSWKVISNLMGRSVKNSNIKELIIDGVKEKNDLEMAELFNGFFTSVGSQIHASISNSNTNMEMSFSNPNSFFLEPVSPEEIHRIILSLKNTKSHIDHMPVSVLCEPLSILINKSFCKGIFPDILKKARVAPVFKGGDSCSINNQYSAQMFEFVIIIGRETLNVHN